MKRLLNPVLGGLGFATTLAAAPAPVDFREHLGLQLYSLREMMRANEPGALDLARSYGFTEIEGAGVNSLPPAEYLKGLAVRGLTLVSAGFGYEQLKKDCAAAVASARSLGVHYVMVAWIPHDESGLTAAEAHQAAADFNQWGAAFRTAGIRFCYHPHGYEFIPFPAEQGRTAFDLLMRETKAEDVSFEMDVFWIYHAGQDPVELLKAYQGRWRLMHLKDLRRGAARGIIGGSRAPATDNVAVGDGEIDWKKVLATAQEVGVEHYFIEDETPDPQRCIPLSLKYLRTLKL